MEPVSPASSPVPAATPSPNESAASPAPSPMEPEKWTLRELLLRMKVSTLWACIVSLFVMLSGAVALGAKLSALSLPAGAQVAPVPVPSGGREAAKPEDKIELFAFHTGDRAQPFGTHFNCRTDDVAPKQLCGTQPVVDVKRIASVRGGSCGFNYYVVACAAK